MALIEKAKALGATNSKRITFGQSSLPKVITLDFVPDFIVMNVVINSGTYISIFVEYDSEVSTTKYRDYQYGTSTNSLHDFDSRFSLSGNVLTTSHSFINYANSQTTIIYGKY